MYVNKVYATRHSTSVAQLPVPYSDSSLSTTGTSLGDDHPRIHTSTRLQKRKEDERRNNGKGKAKRQRTSTELDTTWKRHRLIAKEIATKEPPGDRDTDDSVVVDDYMTIPESRATLPLSDRNFCRSFIEKPMDISLCH